MSKKLIVEFPIPNDPDKASITIQHLTPGEVADIEAQLDLVGMRLVESNNGTLLREGDLRKPQGDDRYLYAVKAVVNWKNIFDEDGKKPQACTPANVIKMCRSESILDVNEKGEPELISFGEFIGRCREKLTKQDKERREKIEKNS